MNWRLSLKVEHDVAVKDVAAIDDRIGALYREIARREKQIAALGKERTRLEIRIARLAGQLEESN